MDTLPLGIVGSRPRLFLRARGWRNWKTQVLGLWGNPWGSSPPPHQRGSPGSARSTASGHGFLEQLVLEPSRCGRAIARTPSGLHRVDAWSSRS